ARPRAVARRPDGTRRSAERCSYAGSNVCSTGTRHRPAVAALKQRVVVAQKTTCAVCRTQLTPLADAEPSTAVSRNQAELEHVRDAGSSLTAGVRPEPCRAH